MDHPGKIEAGLQRGIEEQGFLEAAGNRKPAHALKLRGREDEGGEGVHLINGEPHADGLTRNGGGGDGGRRVGETVAQGHGGGHAGEHAGEHGEVHSGGAGPDEEGEGIGEPEAEGEHAGEHTGGVDGDGGPEGGAVAPITVEAAGPGDSRRHGKQQHQAGHPGEEAAVGARVHRAGNSNEGRGEAGVGPGAQEHAEAAKSAHDEDHVEMSAPEGAGAPGGVDGDGEECSEDEGLGVEVGQPPEAGGLTEDGGAQEPSLGVGFHSRESSRGRRRMARHVTVRLEQVIRSAARTG